ncbi:hypothetical protein MUK70_13215 [Dyadobacter chenwenxiniae]|uniref:Uncharacterized protein n=1 Tax=Dyadobacter chenwenxiniae TaxID=2906456 RepID=A0A9X1TDD5_9BACT|nr:hypothetical protein [Dyadobacter chenwenxiniae]MCF0060205.1 hypothetical protein [Dyadobacter chenwenxiniae]UON85942.1 hypothetical protein MUK70_13215 [Dyadobacter chenwenxiniae]
MDFLYVLLDEILAPRVIFVLAFIGSISYLIIYKCQNRFRQTEVTGFVSSGFQIMSIISGIKLIIRVLIELDAMEMDKFYTGYGGATVIWISMVTLGKRFSQAEKA